MNKPMNTKITPPQRKNLRLKISPKLEAMLIASIIVFLVCFSAFLIYSKSRAVLEQEIKLGLASNAAAAATTIDGDLHHRFSEKTRRDDPAYLSAIMPLEKIRQASTNIRYIYTTILKDNKVYFILNPSPQNDNDGDGDADLPPALMQEYKDPAPELLEALKQQKKLVTNTYSDEWGTFISAYAPFYDSEGRFVGALGMDLALSDFYQRLRPVRTAFEKTAVIVIFIGLIIGLLTWLIRNYSLMLFVSNQQINQQLSCFNEKLTDANNESQYILKKIAEDLPLARSPDKTAGNDLSRWLRSVRYYLASKRKAEQQKRNFETALLAEMVRRRVQEQEPAVTLDFELGDNFPARLFGDPELLVNSLCCLLLFLHKVTKNKGFTLSLELLDEGVDDIQALLSLTTLSDNKFKADFWINLEPDFSTAVDYQEDKFYLYAAVASLRQFGAKNYRFDHQFLCGFAIKLRFDKYLESEE